jgi:prepilin-type N-terminal cleavage/methylation domain-containing protein
MSKEGHSWKKYRQAFSLLELLIVIAIISFSYMLVFSSMKQTQNKPKALGIENLKSTLSEQGLLHTDSELFCLDKCKKCYLYQNGETTAYEGDLALNDLTVYRMNKSEKLEKVDFDRYQDHPVCLRFALHHNGSSSQMVIRDKNGIYYLPALFGKTTKTASLEEAETLWLNNTDLLTDSGEFY